MRVIALDSFDNRKEGDQFDVSEKQGKQLLDKGLVALGPVPENKKAEAGADAANPSPAVGAARPSSASPAAPRSPRPTAKPSGAGKKATKKATTKRAKTAE